ncbi:MAG: E3 binding domain-containing protein, partial [Acidobacteriota bacterium]|nr:E3 binding domain-containing protein [Acidobacteriota bacterium]
MPTDIVMPQMGESIVEGTITKWLKKPGDKVQRDEPLFEISTDKVDAEIPAPASGVLSDIKVTEGNTVQVNTVVGTIAAEGESVAAPPAAKAATTQTGDSQPADQKKKEGSSKPPQIQQNGKQEANFSSGENQADGTKAENQDEHTRSSPLVRKIAREHNISLSQVQGSGLGGRITK